MHRRVLGAKGASRAHWPRICAQALRAQSLFVQGSAVARCEYCPPGQSDEFVCGSRVSQARRDILASHATEENRAANMASLWHDLSCRIANHHGPHAHRQRKVLEGPGSLALVSWALCG